MPAGEAHRQDTADVDVGDAAASDSRTVPPVPADWGWRCGTVFPGLAARSGVVVVWGTWRPGLGARVGLGVGCPGRRAPRRLMGMLGTLRPGLGVRACVGVGCLGRRVRRHLMEMLGTWRLGLVVPVCVVAGCLGRRARRRLARTAAEGRGCLGCGVPGGMAWAGRGILGRRAARLGSGVG
jgi:hypothetical protein